MDDLREISGENGPGHASVDVAAPQPARGKPTKTAGGRSWRLYGLLCILVALVLVVALPSLVQQMEYAKTFGREQARVDVAIANLDGFNVEALSAAFRLVAQRVSPSVVHISTVRVVEHDPEEDEWSFLYGPPHQHETQGQGSGVIVDPQGYIVTNHHVIAGANEILVHLPDGRELPATVVGDDRVTDLAVLKIEAEDLHALPWGDSEELEVGDLVWAVGSPFGLDRSITFGILSAKGRHGRNNPFQDFLQTDAAVNPGNSGGPLVNMRGEVIGINTAIVGRSYQGISFAIPSIIAQDIYQRLKTTGKVARGWLGVGLQPVTPSRAEELGMPEPKGLYVSNVIEDSPAGNAGIEIGDVILTWDGTDVLDNRHLSRLVAKTQIGGTAEVTLLRGGEKTSVTLKVGERPQDR